MSNHPNRSRAKSPVSNPTPEQIRAARKAARLNQTDAGALIYASMRTWQDWESVDQKRRMHPALFELFCAKTQQPELWGKISERLEPATKNNPPEP